MKKIRPLFLLTFSVAINSEVIYLNENDTSCSIEKAFQDFAKGLIDVSSDQFDDRRAGVEELLTGISEILLNGIKKSNMSNQERQVAIEKINKLNKEIINIIPSRSQSALVRTAEERQTMVAGLKQIMTAVFAVVMDPNSLKSYLITIFSGITKVLSAIFADGKIDKNDFNNFLGAIGDLLGTRSSLDIVENQNCEVFF